MMRALILLSFIMLTPAFAQIDKVDPQSLNSAEKVNYLWLLSEEKSLDPVFYYSVKEGIYTSELSLTDTLRLELIEKEFGNKSEMFHRIDRLTDTDALRFASDKERFASLNILLTKRAESQIQKAQKKIEAAQSAAFLSSDELIDLFDYDGMSSYQNGKYEEGIKLFLFCRKNRVYPCLFVMKDRHNQVVRKEDGSLWTLPGLAYSRNRYAYNVVNGQTPQGVHQMDSVMPYADQVRSFGKWRRVILNWVPRSQDERLTKSILPRSSANKNWWKQASIARDVGRTHLRIHGTGNKNTDRNSPHYTFYGTAGCVSTQENVYDGIEYKGQRILLDKMMETMNLLPVFSNETKIKGLLFVIDIDNKSSKVTEEDLAEFGIL